MRHHMVGAPTVEVHAVLTDRVEGRSRVEAVEEVRAVVPRSIAGTVCEHRPVMLNCGTITSSTSSGTAADHASCT